MTGSWWRGWTPTGAVVTCSSALATLMLLATGCWLCLHGNVTEGLQVLGFAGFSGMATNSVAARTRPDPVAIVDPPPGPEYDPEPGEL